MGLGREGEGAAAVEVEEDFATLFAQSEAKGGKRQKIEVGQLVRGRVVAVGNHTAFVEIGAKGEAQLDLSEYRDPRGPNVVLAEGDTVEATVSDDGSTSGTIILKQTFGRGGHVPGEIHQAFDIGAPIEGLVTGENKGGFDIQLAGARAFCPRSQIDRKRGDLNAVDYLNRRFSFRISRIDQASGDIVVSRRALLDDEAAKLAATTWLSIEEGAVLNGTVTNLQPFGAFVDLGGVEGLIHVSQLRHGRVGHPSDVLNIGDRVDVRVVKIQERLDGKRQIGLSLKDLATDPWTAAATTFPPGLTIVGRVRRLEPFGAFVEVAPGIEGLIHISKITLDRRLSHARQVLEIDQEIEVTVLSTDPGQRRMSLSLVENEREQRNSGEARERAEAQAVLEEQNRPQSLGQFASLLGRSGTDS